MHIKFRTTLSKINLTPPYWIVNKLELTRRESFYQTKREVEKKRLSWLFQSRSKHAGHGCPEIIDVGQEKDPTR